MVGLGEGHGRATEAGRIQTMTGTGKWTKKRKILSSPRFLTWMSQSAGSPKKKSDEKSRHFWRKIMRSDLNILNINCVWHVQMASLDFLVEDSGSQDFRCRSESHYFIGHWKLVDHSKYITGKRETRAKSFGHNNIKKSYNLASLSQIFLKYK